MRRSPSGSQVFGLVLGMALAGCESILGITEHKLAPQGGDGGSLADVAAPSEDAPAPGTDAAPGPDSGASADGSGDAGNGDDSSESGPDAAPPENEAGARPLACAGDSGTCVVGGVLSVGSAPGPAGTGGGSLPDGAPAAVIDDGFELGGTTCDTTGVLCVTGAITP